MQLTDLKVCVNISYVGTLKRSIEEPLGIKSFMKSLLSSGVSPKYVVWLGNRLAKYIWSSWGDELKAMGVRWQDFLKVYSETSSSVLEWVKGEKEWDDLLAEIRRKIQAFEARESLGLVKWIRGG